MVAIFSRSQCVNTLVYVITWPQLVGIDIMNNTHQIYMLYKNCENAEVLMARFLEVNASKLSCSYTRH